jgi:hypothetical protein
MFAMSKVQNLIFFLEFFVRKHTFKPTCTDNQISWRPYPTLNMHSAGIWRNKWNNLNRFSIKGGKNLERLPFNIALTQFQAKLALLFVSRVRRKYVSVTCFTLHVNDLYPRLLNWPNSNFEASAADLCLLLCSRYKIKCHICLYHPS